LTKQLLGQVAMENQRLRKPEPYSEKVLNFVGEVLRRKQVNQLKNKIMSLTKPERRQRIRSELERQLVVLLPNHHLYLEVTKKFTLNLLMT
jgi:hypothetical protein